MNERTFNPRYRAALRLVGVVALAACFSGALYGQVTITTVSADLDPVRVGQSYSRTLLANGTAPFAWVVTAGGLPPGLTLSGAGVISGTPTQSGSSTFTVQVTDSAAMPGMATAMLTMTVPLSVTTTTLLSGTLNQAYSQTLAASVGGATPYQWSVVAPNLLPPGLSVSASGVISGTPSAAGTFVFEVVAEDNGGALDSDPKTLAITIGTPVSITTTAVVDGLVGTPYTPQALQAAGGTPPYFWGVASGIVPPGVTLSGGGVLGGTPTVAGRYSFDVTVHDSASPQRTATASLSVGMFPVITTVSLPLGTVGQQYVAQTLTASPGTTPYTWSVVSGSLPNGLKLSSAGVLSGTPTRDGTFTVRVGIVDGSSPPLSAEQSLSITIQSDLRITTGTKLPDGVAGAFYTTQIVAAGPLPITFSVFSGALPPGMALSASGSVSGTPAVSGSFQVTVQAAAGTPIQTVRETFQLSIAPALTITTISPLPGATLSAPYSESLTATGGRPGYTWKLQTGVLPPGLGLSTSGVLAGTPTALGTFSFTIEVDDRYIPSNQSARNFTLVVGTGLAISTLSLPSAIEGLQYAQVLTAVGGTPPLTWTVSSGTLPAGLQLSVPGVISGTPTTVGSETFTVIVTDAQAKTSSREFTLGVDPPIPALSAPSLPLNLAPRTTSAIAIELAAPHPSALSGELTLAYTSTAEVPVNDPMTRFSSGSRVANFTIPEGTTSAVFSSDLMLLVGTVTGTIRLTASFDDGPADVLVSTVSITATAPQITAVTATRTGGGLEVQLTGYSPMRRVTNVEFVFDVRVGGTLQKVALSRPVDADFRNWFTNPASVDFGSAFSFVQSFLITGGGTTDVEAVTVRLVNAQGGGSFGPVQFQ